MKARPATFWLHTLLGLGAAFGLSYVSVSPALAEPQFVPQQADFANVAPASFSNVALNNMRGSVGFSFAFLESYASNVKMTDGMAGQAPRLTSIQPSLLLRERGERSNLSFIYSFGLGKYNGGWEGSTLSHLATLDFSRKLSRKASFELTNRFSSTINDYGTSFSPTPLANGASTILQDVDVNRQRITQESLIASLQYQLGRKGRLTGFGGYNLWRFGGGDVADSHRFEVGIRSEQQINKWLFLDNSYTTSISEVTTGPSAAKTHRLQVGGLTFRPRRGVELSMGGGAEMTTHDNKREFGSSAQAGVSKQSKSTLLSIVYNRGFSGAVGTTDIFTTNNISASYTQWLSRRVTLSVSSRYSVGSSKSGASLEYVLGTAGLGFAVTDHSLVSADYSYLSQELSKLNIGSPRSNRYWARLSFQYSLPSLRIH